MHLRDSFHSTTVAGPAGVISLLDDAFDEELTIGLRFIAVAIQRRRLTQIQCVAVQRIDGIVTTSMLLQGAAAIPSLSNPTSAQRKDDRVRNLIECVRPITTSTHIDIEIVIFRNL